MNIVQRTLLLLLRVYQWTLSPLFTLLCGPSCGCRHFPSCSHYAAEAVRTWGAWSGSWLALKRLARCHPWGTAGYDPVPGRTPLRPSDVRYPATSASAAVPN